MITLHFAAHDLISPVIGAGVWLVFGALIGTIYFLTLRWSIRLLTRGRSPLLALVAQLGRFGAIAAMLAAVTMCFGALALLVATIGILVARTAIVRVSVAQP
jgi:N-ATPase, AtpR subunit